MLVELLVNNVRSIRAASISPALMTVLYGPNGSGKSSLMHAIAIFKNVLNSPGPPVDRFFKLGSTDLGGFEQVVYQHARLQSIEIEVTCSHGDASASHAVRISSTGCTLTLRAQSVPLLGEFKSFDLAWPGKTGQYEHDVETRLDASGTNWLVKWDGAVAKVFSPSPPEAAQAGGFLADTLNGPARVIRGSEWVPLSRAFSRPHYTRRDPDPATYGEDRLANRLFVESSLETQVDQRLRAIVGRGLRARSLAGTDLFILEAVDPETGLTTTLVNEGAGINQVAYLLTQSLLESAPLITVEEPEIHLHPSAVRRLAYALLDIAKDADRTFIVSTHSESFVVALLGAVAQGKVDSQDLACYLVTKHEGCSAFERQQVTSTGQIEGGLRPFMEAQLEDLKHVLGLARDRK